MSPAVEELAEEMVRRWRDGERPLAEEFVERCPELRDQPEAILELLAEELALRAEFGMETSAAELAVRFPKWSAQVAALLDCQRALGSHEAAPLLPAAGERLGDFQLFSILGSGAQGQVYLATQPSLAARPVVLKLGPGGDGEHLSLARLQHTHIVPLYSVHEFPDRGLRGLCMPYFGGTTLAELLMIAEQQGDQALTGRDLLMYLGRANSIALDEPARSPTRSFLDQATIPEVICWIGACVADALQYAHDRGLVHLDVKPSNVLIAADGTPMLLDFHLACAPLQAGDPAPKRLGGTHGFMSPEQVAAMQAVAAGGRIMKPVDARADIFALGVLLAHCLRRFTGKSRPNSVALADILVRCTSPDAEDRYPTAAALASDLRRHLSDLPLRGVRNRSWMERWNKWRRRRPYALPLFMTLAAMVLICVGLLIRASHQVRGAEALLETGDRHLAEHRYRQAAESFRGGEALIDGVALQSTLRERFREGRFAAERGQMAADLHELCDRVRPLWAADAVATEPLQAIAGQCRALWAERDAIGRQLEQHESTWRRDLLDLGILTAHLEVRSAEPDDRGAARRRALDILAEAESMFGQSTVLHLERANYLRDLKQVTAAEQSERRAGELAPQSAWEFLVVGRSELAAGDLRRANASLDRSLALDPRSLWSNYFKGLCAVRHGETTEAVAAFSACVALAPDSPWCVYNRGVAFLKDGQPDSALRDFNRAIALDPHFANAYLSRAALHRQAGRTAEADADLKRAEENGIGPQ